MILPSFVAGNKKDGDVAFFFLSKRQTCVGLYIYIIYRAVAAAARPRHSVELAGHVV